MRRRHPINALRERHITRIEREVDQINFALVSLVDDEDRLPLEERRKALWLRRSDLVRKCINP